MIFDEWDWKAIGAAAGPALALAGLTWQAAERLRRPVVDTDARWEVSPVFRRGHQTGEWNVSLEVDVRIMNPRPTSIVVEGVELQARAPGARTVESVAVENRIHHVPAGSEAIVMLEATMESVRDLRVLVRFRGATRRFRGDWEISPGAAAFAKRDEMLERRGAARG